MALPDRSNHMALAILASFQSDLGAKIVQDQGNQLVPYVQGNFDLRKAAISADNAAKQWDAAFAAEQAKVEAALAAAAKPAEVTTVQVAEVATAQVSELATAQVPALESTAPPAWAVTPTGDAGNAPGSSPGA